MRKTTSVRSVTRPWRRDERAGRRDSRLRARARRNADIETPPKFLAADFSCGAGGTTRGLIDAGGHVVAGIDKERRCERTFVENNTNEHGERVPPAFLARDIFPKTAEYAEGEQQELAVEFGALIKKA